MTKKNFNQHIYVAVLLWVAALSPSCKRLIEIPPNPPTSIAQAQQFADSAITMTSMASIYSYPSNGVTGFTFNDGLLSVNTGLSSDELGTSLAGSDNNAFFNENLLSVNYIVNSLWTDPYTGLYPVNATIEGVAASPGLSAGLRQQLTGELKVVRAMYYFHLVNLFGAVPLVTTSDYKQTAQSARTSVDSVYGQIIR